MNSKPAPKKNQDRPRLGLVCMTVGPEVRFRTITRAFFLRMAPHEQAPTLRALYADNLERLLGALTFCAARKIQLYRMPCEPFRLNEHTIGQKVLQEMAPKLAPFGREAERLGIRVLMHPDQFVVLNSVSPQVVKQSIGILERHALVFDLLGLPRSPWSALIVHGGKSGRADELVSVIKDLPAGIHTRLVLENDERAYSATQILEICRRAGVPMVFDPHHHVVKEKLDTYEHPSIAEMVRESKTTWPDPKWQLAHLSNGLEFFGDLRHSDLITSVPTALLRVPWVEVEAKGKELAVYQLRKQWPTFA